MDRGFLQPLMQRLVALFATRGGQALLVAYLVVTGVGAFVPMADHLGFELALALTVAAALVAPAAGAAAMGRRVTGARPGLDALAGALYSGLALLLPVGVMLLNGVRRPVCDPLAGMAWMVLLPLPTALLAATAGSLARLRTRTRKGTAAFVAAILAVALLPSLWEVYAGPAFFFFDHFFGYVPGPLYDEVVTAGAPILAFRGLTLLWAVAGMLACAAHAPRSGSMGTAAALLATGLLAAGWYGGTRLGWRSTDEAIAAALGGNATVDGVEIHFPKEWPEERREQFIGDVAFRAHQVRERLGLDDPAPVRVWMYRSTAEKRRLVGAARTSFAKPWRREIHIHAAGHPHPVLRHELVHAYAADAARGPFRTPGGLLPNSALVEGLAMAFDVPAEGELTLEQWARAMRDRKLAPDLPALLSPAGFHGAAAGRAYTYTGAFLRYLEGRFGAGKVLEVYGSGNLADLGDPRELVEAFERHLDGVEVGEAQRAAAERRYARPSVFRRPCARDVSRLVERAGTLARSDPAAAVRLYERACALEPDDPALLRSLLSAARRTRDENAIRSASERLFGHPKLDVSLRASALVEAGDDLWGQGRLGEARALFEEAAALPVDAGTHRGAAARVEALAVPAREPLLRGLLAEGDAGVDRLFALHDHLGRHPNDALVAYLLGRQLVQRQALDRGIGLLRWAEGGALPDPTFVRETRRLLAQALSESHRCEELDALIARSEGAAEADLVWARDWAERCRFETGRARAEG